nr:pilin [Marinobacter panjinensis]
MGGRSAIIGILAAIAIPAHQEYQDRVRNTSAYSTAQPLQQQVTAYAYDNQAWPTTMEELGYAQPTLSDLDRGYEIDIYENGLIGVEVGTDASGESQYIILEPEVVEGDISWVCFGQNVKAKLLAPECK